MVEMFTIYKWTSKESNKSYVGLTAKTAEERFEQHVSHSKNPVYLFHKAIAKYGPENFVLEILEQNIETREEANEREIYYIDSHGTYESGYNMTKGGEGGLSPEAIEKMLNTRKEVIDGESSYSLGGVKTLHTKRNTVLPDGRTLLQATVDKTAETRRERGDFDELAKKFKGRPIGDKSSCIHCGKVSDSGNLKRWHNDNCKMNPTITDEKIIKRNLPNQGSGARFRS